MNTGDRIVIIGLSFCIAYLLGHLWFVVVGLYAAGFLANVVNCLRRRS